MRQRVESDLAHVDGFDGMSSGWAARVLSELELSDNMKK